MALTEENATAFSSGGELDKKYAGLIRKLQADWKAIGPVKKSRSEALWQKFRAACDTFFTRYASRHDVAQYVNSR